MTALAKAIVETAALDASRLRARAYESLRNYELDPRKAIGDFVGVVRSDRGLLFELIGYVAVRDRALVYLDSAAADMRNETEGGEAHLVIERRPESRSPPSAPLSDAGDAQVKHERQSGIRSPAPEALPALIPLPKRGPAELKAIKAASPASAFDSIRLRDKSPIGDLQWRVIGKFIRDNSYEAALLMKVRDYCVPADQSLRIRDLVPLAEFERMVQQAAQVAGSV